MPLNFFGVRATFLMRRESFWQRAQHKTSEGLYVHGRKNQVTSEITKIQQHSAICLTHLPCYKGARVAYSVPEVLTWTTGWTRSKQDQRRGFITIGLLVHVLPGPTKQRALKASKRLSWIKVQIISPVASFVLGIHFENSHFCDSRCPFGQIDNRKHMLGRLRSKF